ncbi:hypothetical protein BDZ89DRAFT_1077652 [Hymenopellis radicata]|nr:hypothetical protein BDZ89DRAFT_1077652 [Hymenopellis radicata]
MANDTPFDFTNRKAVNAALEPHLHAELASAVKGPVYLREAPSDCARFPEFTTMFNGNVTTAAKAVVLPVDAKDVSSIVTFCLKHSLSPSVKAGGFGVAGWAVGGDIVIDLCRIADTDIEVPAADGSYTGLADMCPPGSKGKQVTNGKRRREDEERPVLGRYHLASAAVQNFLKPSALRRRIDQDGSSVPSERAPSPPHIGDPGQSRSFDVPPSSASASSLSPLSVSPPTSASTGAAGPSSIHNPPPAPSRLYAATQSDGDPFGYISSGPAPVQDVIANYPPSSAITSWSSGVPLPNPFAMGQHYGAPTPIHPHVYVTFGSGMRQKQIDIFTSENPVEAKSVSGGHATIPYHVPFAAHPVGSSIMILGGFGFLGRLHGLSVDNLVEVEMVLADGSIVIVNEDSHPDLWWAVRGAGPAFGIATRYKAKAFPVPHVFAGNIIYRFHPATAASLIKHFRDCVKGAPRELYANVLLTAGPEGKDSLVVIQMCYVGTKEKGQEFLAAISSWTGETCLLNEVHEKSFLHQQDSVAQVLRAKAGRQWFIRSALITSLPDDVVHDTVLQFANTPIGCTWLFELTGGRIADIEGACIPKAQRQALFTIAALHQWEMGVDDPRCIASAEEWIADTLGPHQTGGPLPSFLGRHEAPSRIMACYGEENFARLKEIKKKYDPDNMFANSLWPVDTADEPFLREPGTPEP